MLRRNSWTEKRGAPFVSLIRAAGANVSPYRPRTAWGWAEERVFLAKWPKTIRYGVLGVARRGSTRQDVPGKDPRIMVGLDFIALHFADPFIGVRDVAMAMGMGSRQAERLFAALGKSIHAHIEEARLAKAHNLLRSSTTPIGEVARLSGFTSETYFSRIFHRRTGLAPLAFRRSS